MNNKRTKSNSSGNRVVPSVPKKKAKTKDTLKELDTKIQQKIREFKESREGRLCYPLLLHNTSIKMRVVDDVFDDLRTNFKDCNGRLDVIVDSSGGNINSAYNLALLLRKFGTSDLIFFVPRWAKSAATLLVCSGDRIIMSPVAELGPLDPQIFEMNPLEQRLEQFSPLHIDATLSLIREEFENGHEKLAKGLMERLQFPLTLGSFRKSLDISREYLSRLLSSRMLKGNKAQEEAKRIAETLTEGYADHEFCINVDEAKAIGLEAEEMQEPQLNILWDIHKFGREREIIKAKQKRKEMEEALKNLPPELLDKLPTTLKDVLPKPSLPERSES